MDNEMGVILKQPALGKWTCHMFGGIEFTPRLGDEPNWFWRWMQFLVLGNRWVKRG